MLKITTLSESAETLSLSLIGDLRAEELPTLAAAVHPARLALKRISLNLEEVTLVDRAAMKQLCLWKQAGFEISHCPNYVSAWIQQDSGG